MRNATAAVVIGIIIWVPAAIILAAIEYPLFGHGPDWITGAGHLMTLSLGVWLGLSLSPHEEMTE